MNAVTAFFGHLFASSLAGNIQTGINAVQGAGGDQPIFAGSFTELFTTFAGYLVPLFNIGAVIMISIAAFRMVLNPQDDMGEKMKTVIELCVSGLILVNLVNPFISAFYGAAGEVVQPGGAAAGATILSNAIGTLITIVLGIAVPIGIFSIIFSGFSAVISGSDEGLGTLKRAVFATIAGIVLLLVRAMLALMFGVNGSVLTVISGGPQGLNPDPLAALIVTILGSIIKYVGIFALGILIFAGLQILTSQGDDSKVTKGRELIIRVLIGLTVILLASLIIQTVVVLVWS